MNYAQLMMIALLAVCTVAYIATYALPSKFPESLKERIRSGEGILLIVFGALYEGNDMFSSLFLVLTGIAIAEITNGNEAGHANPNITYKQKEAAYLLSMLMLVMLMTDNLVFYKLQNMTNGYILFALMTTQLNDVNQFICGKLFGKHKMCPKISPNKTIEGAVFGTLLTTGISCLVSPLLIPFSTVGIICSTIVLCILGILGDLTVSKFKRLVDIKDMSNLIPGHGGVMDRLDSLLYTPFFLLLMINVFG